MTAWTCWSFTNMTRCKAILWAFWVQVWNSAIDGGNALKMACSGLESLEIGTPILEMICYLMCFFYTAKKREGIPNGSLKKFMC